MLLTWLSSSLDLILQIYTRGSLPRSVYTVALALHPHISSLAAGRLYKRVSLWWTSVWLPLSPMMDCVHLHRHPSAPSSLLPLLDLK